ncbi:hypothetical protein BGW37DRAFT_476167 [Umbelopsis sp. PMI_123]|nr:hypothetical protein BGW37DRAFT_476167 [Umbelopsis sp. PMI_123]
MTSTNTKRHAEEVLSPSQPVRVLHSQLTYRRGYSNLACSQTNILVATKKPTASPCSIEAITENTYTSNSQPKRTAMLLAQQYHGHYAITHLEWNQRGNYLATIDETGKLAIWEQTSTRSWTHVYCHHLQQPAVAFLWLNSERSYSVTQNTDGGNKYVLDQFVGPRNPFGHLAFLIVTVNGEITVHYQRNSSIFSSFSTNLLCAGQLMKQKQRKHPAPYTIFKQQSKESLDFSMIAGRSWKKISHASLLLNTDGKIYLASHNASSKPKEVYLTELQITFPLKINEGIISCKPISQIHLTAPLVDKSLRILQDPFSSVTHLLLLKGLSHVRLALAIGKIDEITTDMIGEAQPTYNSAVAVWELTEMSKQIPADFLPEGNNGSSFATPGRKALKLAYGHSVPDRLITVLKAADANRDLVVGFSDGSIQMEYRDSTTLGLSKSNEDWTSSNDDISIIGSSFWEITGPHQFDDGVDDPVRDIITSANETHLIYMFSSGKMGSRRITSDQLIESTPDTRGTKESLGQLLILGLLNHVDCSDLFTEAARLIKENDMNDFADQLVQDILIQYEQIYNFDKSDVIIKSEDGQQRKDTTIPEVWSSTQLVQLFTFLISIYRTTKSKTIQCRNLFDSIQLHAILECLMSSCLSDYDLISRLFAVKEVTKIQDINLEFDIACLWPLVPLSSWVMDYIVTVMQAWSLLFNRRVVNGNAIEKPTTTPNPTAILLHAESRECIRRLLLLIDRYASFVNSTTIVPNNKQVLESYVKSILEDNAISIKAMLEFLLDLDDTDKSVKSQSVPNSNASTFSLLTNPILPNDKLQALQELTAKHKQSCTSSAFFLLGDMNTIHPLYDTQHKSMVNHAYGIHRCIGCYQKSISEIPQSGVGELGLALQTPWQQNLIRFCLCDEAFT